MINGSWKTIPWTSKTEGGYFDYVAQWNKEVLSTGKALNQKHEELIKIKDEYKRENEKLRVENGCLKNENEGLFASHSSQGERFTDSSTQGRGEGPSK